MFANKRHSKKFWAIAVVLIALVTVTLVLQAQIIMMLKDLQTSIFRNFVPTSKIEYVMDSNPQPVMRNVDYVMDSNPQPVMKLVLPGETVSDSNPHPPM